MPACQPARSTGCDFGDVHYLTLRFAIFAAAGPRPKPGVSHQDMRLLFAISLRPDLSSMRELRRAILVKHRETAPGWVRVTGHQST